MLENEILVFSLVSIDDNIEITIRVEKLLLPWIPTQNFFATRV